MKKIALFLLCVLNGLTNLAQNSNSPDSLGASEKVYTFVDTMPEFPGGQLAMFRFIDENKVYPSEELSKRIEGTMYLTFVVRADGTVSDVKEVRRIQDGLALSREALRVVRSMPKWKPGILNGQPISVQMNLPVKFEIKEIPPEFPGGIDSLVLFIKKNIEYPIYEKRNGIDGVVYVTYVISKEGEVHDVKIARGVKGGEGLDKEAIRIAEKMPRWIPGTLNGKPVNVQYNLPVKFTLP